MGDERRRGRGRGTSLEGLNPAAQRPLPPLALAILKSQVSNAQISFLQSRLTLTRSRPSSLAIAVYIHTPPPLRRAPFSLNNLQRRALLFPIISHFANICYPRHNSRQLPSSSALHSKKGASHGSAREIPPFQLARFAGRSLGLKKKTHVTTTLLQIAPSNVVKPPSTSPVRNGSAQPLLF